jgi:hypothetical protein
MKEKEARPVPHARKDGLVVQELAEEMLVYDLERHKAHCLNHTAAWIWKHCDGRTTVAEIARLLQAELKRPVDEEMIWFAVDQLGRDHLLRERIMRPAETVGMSRRELVKQLGMAAIVALPLVTSIVSPTAIQAATCLGSGAACTSSVQCCSGLCQGILTCA